MRPPPRDTNPKPRRSTPARWQATLISAMAVILVSAASGHEEGLERLRRMPAGERERLLENLRDFDLTLTSEQRAAVRALDRELAAASPEQRAVYLSVLRRYHLWLESLPEPRREDLASAPSSDRMAMVRSLLAKHPAPSDATPTALRVLDPGEYNPFEVASAYRIWQSLDEKQRTNLERKSPDRARRESLFASGEKAKDAIPRETRPDDFEEEKWLGLLRDALGGLRPLAAAEDPAKKHAVEAVRKRVEVLRPEILRRQAINLYVSRAEERPVDPDRLARFIAGLPPWVSTCYDSLAPDDARRRMAFAYRLVFPAGREIGSARKPAAGAPRGRPAPAPKAGAAQQPKAGAPPRPKAGAPSQPKVPPAVGEGDTPF